MGLSFISLRKFFKTQFKIKFSFKLRSKTTGQVMVEAVLSLLVLFSFLYLLQKLYKESGENIQKARLSSQFYFKAQGKAFQKKRK